MTKVKKFQIDYPKGNLAVLLPGLGAVSTTFIAGVHAPTARRTCAEQPAPKNAAIMLKQIKSRVAGEVLGKRLPADGSELCTKLFDREQLQQLAAESKARQPDIDDAYYFDP